MPRRWISCCCLAVISRLSQTKELDRFVDVDDAPRLGEQRGGFHVGRQDLAVAVENVRPGGGDCVLGGAAAGRMVVRREREGDEPDRDHRIDESEPADRERDARLGLGVAIDVAAVEERAQDAPPPRLRPIRGGGKFCDADHRAHLRADESGRLPVRTSAIGSAVPGGTICTGRSGRRSSGSNWATSTCFSLR
jgi:hypothetical protein